MLNSLWILSNILNGIRLHRGAVSRWESLVMLKESWPLFHQLIVISGEERCWEAHRACFEREPNKFFEGTYLPEVDLRILD